MADLRVSLRQLLRKPILSSSSEVPAPPAETLATIEPDGRSAVAKRLKRFRNKLKEDPERWKLHQNSEKERFRKIREQRTPEQRKAAKDASRLRTEKCREKKKALGLPLNSKSKKDTTRYGVLLKRQKDAEWQRRCRENMSHQKKAAIASKRKKKREAASLEVQPAEPSTSFVSPVQPKNTGFKTGSTRRKAIKKTKDTCNVRISIEIC